MSDAYWGSVTLNLRFEGGSFIDDKGKTIITNGGATLSSAQFKYGAQSFFANGGYLTTTSSGILANEDFTMEFWCYPTSLGGNTSLVEDIGARSGLIFLAGGTLYWVGSGDSDIGTSGYLSANTWQHVAVSRSSNTLKIFLNGNQVGSGYSSTVLHFNTIANDMYGQQYSGYFDDIRVTKGVARYTSNFTPPDAIWDGSISNSLYSLPSSSLTLTTQVPSYTTTAFSVTSVTLPSTNVSLTVHNPSIALIAFGTLSFSLPSNGLTLIPQILTYIANPFQSTFYLPSSSLNLTVVAAPIISFSFHVPSIALHLNPLGFAYINSMPIRWKILRESKQTNSFQAIVAKLGEGFVQNAPKGLRSKEVSWQVQWVGLTTEEKDIVSNGLTGFGFHINIYWKAPYQDEAETFLSKEPFKVSKDSLLTWNISATLIRKWNNSTNLTLPYSGSLSAPVTQSPCSAYEYTWMGTYPLMACYDWDTSLFGDGETILEVPWRVDGHIILRKTGATLADNIVVEATGSYTIYAIGSSVSASFIESKLHYSTIVASKQQGKVHQHFIIYS